MCKIAWWGRGGGEGVKTINEFFFLDRSFPVLVGGRGSDSIPAWILIFYSIRLFPDRRFRIKYS